jgi:hypothetical protein
MLEDMQDRMAESVPEDIPWYVMVGITRSKVISFFWHLTLDSLIIWPNFLRAQARKNAKAKDDKQKNKRKASEKVEEVEVPAKTRKTKTEKTKK